MTEINVFTFTTSQESQASLSGISGQNKTPLIIKSLEPACMLKAQQLAFQGLARLVRHVAFIDK